MFIIVCIKKDGVFGTPIIARGESYLRDDLTRLINSGEVLDPKNEIYKIGEMHPSQGITNTDIKKLFKIADLIKKSKKGKL